MKHHNWRDLQEWRSEGLEFSTTSNEAAKLYDAVNTQVMGWYDDPQMDGIEGSLGKLIAADPEFVLARALSAGLQLLGTGASIQTDPNLKKEIDYLQSVPKSKMNNREYKHVQAVLLWAKGELVKSAAVYEEILVEFPTDVHALKMVYDLYFYLGDAIQIRDCVARVLPIWDSKSRQVPLKGYLHGMLAFGLEETNFYDKAEREARKGLELNASDSWSTHSLAHVFEMEGRTKEGVSFLNDTVADWTPCTYLACHNYWHLGLYHVERGELDDAISVFDAQINPRVKERKAMLDIVDATSLLYRLHLARELDGGAGDFNLSGRWADIYDICEPHLHDQILGFNDAHFMMSYLGTGNKSVAKQLVDNSIHQAKRPESAMVHYVETVSVTTALLKAMVAYEAGKYAQVVELLYPIRNSIVNIGGSHAQRDVFQQLLLCAAIKSGRSNAEYKKLAHTLLNERKCIRDVSPLTDRYTKMFQSKC